MVMSNPSKKKKKRVKQQWRRYSNSTIQSLILFLAALSHSLQTANAANAYNDDDSVDKSLYSTYGNMNWLYDSSSIAIKVEGCVWGLVTQSADSGEESELGCLENDSEDGTTSWYMMSNCRRAQVAYSVYASSSGSTKCKSSDFVGSFVTKDGVGEAAYLLATYDKSGIWNLDQQEGGGEQEGEADDGDDGARKKRKRRLQEDGMDNLPTCEEYEDGRRLGDGDGYYVSMACEEDGSFTVGKFADQYCQSFVETIDVRTDDYYYDDDDSYSIIHTLNDAFMQYSCSQCKTYGYDDDGNDYCPSLVLYSEPCSSLDSSICTDSDDFSGSGGAFSKWKPSTVMQPSGVWTNRIKYVLGSALLLASTIMFLGILFMNRRRRRAMMHRKYRSSSRRGRGSRSRSGSRKKRSSSSRKGSSSKRQSSSRSRSSKHRSRSRSRSRVDEEEGGVFT